jgi:hypothetical protein
MLNYIKVMQLVEVDINLLQVNYRIMNPPEIAKKINKKKYLFGIVDFDIFNKNPLDIFEKIEKNYQLCDYFLIVLPDANEFIKYEKKFSECIPDYSCWDNIMKIGININQAKVDMFSKLKYQLINI